MILPYSEENPNQPNQAPKLRSKFLVKFTYLSYKIRALL